MLNKAVYNSLTYLLILFIILDSNSVFSASMDIDFHIPETVVILLVLTATIKLFKTKIKLSIIKRIAFFLSIYYLMGLILLFVSVGTDKLFSYVVRFLIILPFLTLFFVSCNRDGKMLDPLNKYVNLITLISVFSLFFWVFGSLLHIISPSGTLNVRWDNINGGAYPTYWGLYFERQTSTFLDYSFYRNQGIFAEGPMFCLCLVLALALELFVLSNEKRNCQSCGYYHLRKKSFASHRFRLIVLSIALITTFTTTGQILLIAMLVLRFYLARVTEKNNQVIKVIVGGIAGIVGLYFAIELFILKSSSISWLIRADDFIAGFRAWLSSPVWGKGFNDMSVLNPYRAAFRGGQGATSNSITMVLAQGGLILFTAYLIPIWNAVHSTIKAKNYFMLAFLLMFIFEFIFAVGAYQSVMLFFTAFLWARILSKTDKKYVPEYRALVQRNLL